MGDRAGNPSLTERQGLAFVPPPATGMKALARKIAPSLKKFFRHPVSAIFWLTVFSLIVKENYPFSHFPMYKGFSEKTHYFYLASEGGPIPGKKIFKVSVPKMKKLYGGHMEKIAEEVSKERGEKFRPYQLGDEEKQEAGRRLLDQLREGTPKKQRKQYADILAKPITLVRVDIRYENDQFSKPSHEVVTH